MANQTILSNTGLSALTQKFRADMASYDPMLFGMMQITDSSVSGNVEVKSDVINDDNIVTVTITVTYNEDANITLTCYPSTS